MSIDSVATLPFVTPTAPRVAVGGFSLRRLTRSPQMLWIAAVIPFVAAGAVSLGRIRSGHNFGNMFDFLDASRAMMAGQDLYASGKGGYVYPPLIAFLYQPLALLSDQLAAMVMLGMEVAAGIFTLVVISRVLAWRLVGSVDPVLIARSAALGSILTADKIKGEFAHLETNVLMLMAYTAAMRWVDRRPWLCGLALGFAFNIKYLPVVLLPWLLLRRRWRASAWFVVWAVGFALLPAVSMGWRGDAHAWGEATGGIGRLFGVVSASAQVARVRLIVDAVSISATSGLARTTGLPPRMAELIAAGIAAMIAGLIVRFYQRSGIPVLRWPVCTGQIDARFRGLFTAEWLGVLLMLLALSPFTNSRHLYMMLDVNIAAAVLLLGMGRRVPRLPLLLATAGLWLGITFPPGGMRVFDQADNWWRSIGGAGWCMLGMLIALVWTNTQYARNNFAGVLESGRGLRRL
jgi:hypothetical protein